MHPMRSARVRQRHALKRGLRSIDAYAFFDLLTDASMLEQVETHLPTHRERLLPPTETLAMFLAQALSADRSCQHAVNAFLARRVAGSLSACSTSTVRSAVHGNDFLKPWCHRCCGLPAHNGVRFTFGVQNAYEREESVSLPDRYAPAQMSLNAFH